MSFPAASDATGPIRRRLPWRLDRRTGLAVLACCLAAVIGVAAYLLARFDGVDASQAHSIERQAFRTSFDQARADAARQAALAGRHAGERAGARAGERAGARLGERRGAAAVERRQQLIAERQAAAAAAAAARRRSGRPQETLPTTPEPAATPPLTEPTPTPAPEPTPTPPAPCFDAAGHPC